MINESPWQKHIFVFHIYTEFLGCKVTRYEPTTWEPKKFRRITFKRTCFLGQEVCYSCSLDDKVVEFYYYLLSLVLTLLASNSLWVLGLWRRSEIKCSACLLGTKLPNAHSESINDINDFNCSTLYNADLPYILPSIFTSHYLYIKNNPVIAIISNIMCLNVCVYIYIYMFRSY